MITAALINLCLGILLYYLGTKLNNGEPSGERKEKLADYHAEITLGGVVFLILSFVSFCYWLYLYLVIAKR